MAEAGGTTTQSGIHYQNSIAALYLGRLLDSRTRTASQRVIGVRVEAPEHVDDIVIRQADGSCTYIQAKEAISLSSEEWKKLWIHFASQAAECSDEKFRLILVMGTISKDIENLLEVCDRAKGKQNSEEWVDSLSTTLKNIADKIINALPGKSISAVFELVKFVEVWIWPLNIIERDLIQQWIPPSTFSQNTLFDLLRGKVGGKARIRASFYAAQLLDELYSENNIKVHDLPAWGINAYFQAIKTEMENLSVPGTRLCGPIDELFFWIPLYDKSNDNGRFDFEEEDLQWRWNRQKEIFDLRNFPFGRITRAVIDAGAGFGKTTMLHAIAHRLSFGEGRVPVIISLDALATSSMTVLGYLSDNINTEYNVSIDWEYLCESGRTVALFDGLDELSIAERTIVLDKIIRFAARFEKSAFLLTVRDSSTLTLPLALPILALHRLDDVAIRQFAEAYLHHGASMTADQLSNHLSCYPDLGKLLRIPLFLALVLASINSKDSLPHSRAELLEHYLSLLFSPERYKAMAVPYNPLYDLREAAEFLAWQGLETDSIGFTEIGARRFLQRQELKEQSDAYIERLVQIGVLQKKATRLRFAYPIVQEYLAACWLVNNIPNEIEPRFAKIYRRPWAQTLQFALEMHTDAENTITNQLNVLVDDAFNTKLRLIARCIVNGTKVNSDVRKLIAEQLVTAWPSKSYTIRESIGYIIADGFVDVLPQKVVEDISSWALSYGGAEIVIAKSSPTFTYDILKKFIIKDLSYQSHLHGWQVAVDEIAEDAIELYLNRSVDERTTEKELYSLASLIASLPPSRLRPDRWIEISNNPSLPSIIRLAGYQLGSRPISADAWFFIDDVIRKSELDEKSSYPYIAYNLYWHIEDAECKFMQLLVDTTVPEKRIRFILQALMRSNKENCTKQAILRQGMNISGYSENIRFLLLLCLATCGDKEAEQATIPLLLNQGFDNITIWLYQANKFCGKTVRDAVQILLLKPLDNDHLLRFIGAADFGLSYKTELSLFDGVAAYEPYIHSARNYMLNKLCSNLKGNDESIDSLIVQMKIGDSDAEQRLVSEIRKFVTSCQGFMLHDDDQKIQNALRHLEGQSTFLPLEMFFEIIDKSSSYAGNYAVKWIVRSGDENAIPKLIERYNSRVDNFVREAIFAGLEILASRYGLCINHKEDKLIILK